MMVMVSLAWVGATQFLKSTYTGLLRGVVDTALDLDRWEELRLQRHRENTLTARAAAAATAAAKTAAVSASVGAAKALGGSSSNTVQDGSNAGSEAAAADVRCVVMFVHRVLQ